MMGYVWIVTQALNIALSSVSKLTMDRQRYGDLILNTKAPVYFEGNLAAPFMCHRYPILLACFRPILLKNTKGHHHEKITE